MNMHVCKTVPIEYNHVLDAYRKVKRGGKAAGIDNESWEEFDRKAVAKLKAIRQASPELFYHWGTGYS